MRARLVCAVWACLAFAALAALAAPTATPARPPEWSACDGGPLTGISPEISPPIPRRGNDATVRASAVLAAPFDGTMVVSIGTGSFMHAMPPEPLSAPAGPLTLERTLRVPSIAPAGRYNAECKLVDQAGAVVLCARVAFSVVA